MSVNWNKRFFLLLALGSLFRLAYLFLAPMDLAGDEAYYWDWSRQLDWGYFSKPPMVAWIIALFTRTFGSTTAVVRLPAVLFAAVSTLMIFLLARRMYDSRTAFWAAAAGMASPGACALSVLMTIDAPVLCFWSVALYMFWAAGEKQLSGRWPRQGGAGRQREAFSDHCSPATGDRLGLFPASGFPLPGLWEWWALAAAIGLGLLSKQIMGVFIGLIFVFAAVSKEDRYLLKSSRPYLFSLLGIAALIPPILWNARHGWITFHHTAGHFEASMSNFMATSAEFIGGQLLIISPLTWILFALLCVFLFLHFKSLNRRELYLLCFSIVPLFGVFILSLRQKIQPNWPAMVYPAGMILLAAWGCGNISAGSRLDSWRTYFKIGVAVGVVMALLTYGFPFWAGAAPGPWAKKVIARLEGWRHIGVETGRALDGVPHPDRTFILTFDRQLAAELAFYVPGQPRVYNWRNPDDLPESQYDIWDGPPVGWDALIIAPEIDPRGPAAIRGYFQVVERLDKISLGDWADSHYRVYLGTSLRRWP